MGLQWNGFFIKFELWWKRHKIICVCTDSLLDCFTAIAWWQQDCQWASKNHLLRLVGLEIGWNCISRMVHMTGGNFQCFWASMTVPNDRQYRTFGLCREIVKEFTPHHNLSHMALGPSLYSETNDCSNPERRQPAICDYTNLLYN